MAPRRPVLRRAQNQSVQRDLPDHPKCRRDVAMRQRALDRQFIRSGADDSPTLEQRLEAVDHIPRQLAQIGQGALLRPALFVATAQGERLDSAPSQ
jgi:hypothetical protein